MGSLGRCCHRPKGGAQCECRLRADYGRHTAICQTGGGAMARHDSARGEVSGWLNGLRRPPPRTEQHLPHWGTPDKDAIMDVVNHDPRRGECAP